MSLALAANSTYAYSFGKASSTAGWEPMAVANNSPYAGGQIALMSPTIGTISISVVSPPPVVLQTAPGSFANGRFHLNFQGLACESYVLQSSTDLMNWTPLQTNNTTADGPVVFTDLTATNTVKFYRVVRS